MKSAYELALERLEERGIAPPRQEALSDETKLAIAEARRFTEAKLAELEILHRDKLGKLDDGLEIEQQEQFYRREKERLVAAGEAAVARLRGPS
jgi:hypothetical protein